MAAMQLKMDSMQDVKLSANAGEVSAKANAAAALGTPPPLSTADTAAAAALGPPPPLSQGGIATAAALGPPQEDALPPMLMTQRSSMRSGSMRPDDLDPPLPAPPGLMKQPSVAKQWSSKRQLQASDAPVADPVAAQKLREALEAPTVEESVLNEALENAIDALEKAKGDEKTSHLIHIGRSMMEDLRHARNTLIESLGKTDVSGTQYFDEISRGMLRYEELRLAPDDALEKAQQAMQRIEDSKTALEKAEEEPLTEATLKAALEESIRARVPESFRRRVEGLFRSVRETGEALVAAFEVPLKLDLLRNARDGAMRLNVHDKDRSKRIKKANYILDQLLPELAAVPEPPPAEDDNSNLLLLEEERITEAIERVKSIDALLKAAREENVPDDTDCVVSAKDRLESWKQLAPKPIIRPGKLRAKHDTALEPVCFWFIRAEKLRAMDSKRLPTLQELKKWDTRDGKGSWLVFKEISPEDAFTGAFSGTVLAVSHRWEDLNYPDKEGEQLKAIKDFLLAEGNEMIQLVWIDFSCLYQGERTPPQEKEFLQVSLCLEHVPRCRPRAMLLITSHARVPTMTDAPEHQSALHWQHRAPPCRSDIHGSLLDVLRGVARVPKPVAVGSQLRPRVRSLPHRRAPQCEGQEYARLSDQDVEA